jgi:hypothetical protein
MPTVITKTVKSAGGDYSSRSAAEAGIQTLYSSNFVTADVQVDVESYNFSDTTALTIDGTTTDATRFWRWKAAAGNRHAGTWSTSAARLVVNGSFAAAATGSDDFTRFEGEQIQNTADRANNARVAEVSSIASGADVQFIGCILRGSGTGVATAVSAGIRAVLAAGNVLRVRNCLIYDNGEGIIDPSGNSNVETDLYNNTIVDNSRNGIKFDNSNHTRRWKNNLSVFNTTADYAISGSGTNDYATNVSSDATSPTSAAQQDADLRQPRERRLSPGVERHRREGRRHGSQRRRDLAVLGRHRRRHPLGHLGRRRRRVRRQRHGLHHEPDSDHRPGRGTGQGGVRPESRVGYAGGHAPASHGRGKGSVHFASGIDRQGRE